MIGRAGMFVMPGGALNAMEQMLGDGSIIRPASVEIR
jgi:hypothetical protein